jgi:hypothetical protein
MSTVASSRRRCQVTRSFSLAILVALLAGGCAALPQPSPTVSVTPEPIPTPAATQSSPAPCTSDRLRLTVTGFGAAAGTEYARLLLVPESGTEACSIQATPGAEIIDPLGTILARSPAGGVDRVLVDQALNTELGWFSWCAPPPRRPLELRLTLEPGPVVVSTGLPDGYGASCMDVPTGIFLNRPFGSG